MKRLLLLILCLNAVSILAQSPQKMSYQAVVRNAGNSLVQDQQVGMQISILKGTITGTSVYVETQVATSNTNGLVSLEIGMGTVVSGTFNSIDWANGPYFIKTETDLNGGNSYTISGTSQLMSVPYALYAATSGSSIPGPKGDKGDKGDAGTNGTDGVKGDTGAKGDKGDAGANGTDGVKGDTGAKGDKGDAGTNGTDGVKGDTGAKGDKGDAGTNGTDGVKGDTGAKGDKGDAGANGTDGVKGDTGAKGDKGDAGTNGSDGAKGDTGAKGDKGDAGTNGTDGAKGDTGAKGDKGDAGTNGSDGAKGDKGDKGDTGTSGVVGAILSTQDVFLSANADRYSINGKQYSASDELRGSLIIPRNGTLQNLYVMGNLTSAAGSNVIITIRINGVDSAVTTTVTGGTNAVVSDTTHSISVSAGDRVTVHFQETNGVSTGVNFTASFEYK